MTNPDSDPIPQPEPPPERQVEGWARADGIDDAGYRRRFPREEPPLTDWHDPTDEYRDPPL